MTDSERVFKAAQDGNLEKLKQILNRKQCSLKNISNTVNTYHAEEENFVTTPLGIAAKRGHNECVKFLIEECWADVDGVIDNNQQQQEECDYFPPLWCAAANNHLDVVMSLVIQGANIDIIVPHTGETPLRAACFAANLDIVKYLVHLRADVEIADKSGLTCLMLACRMGLTDIVKCLVNDAYADINKRDDRGSTALLCATESRKLECVEFLFNQGAKLDVVDSFGNTPLSNAILSNGSFHIVQFLMRNVNKEKQIDALELLGAMSVKNNDFPQAVYFWKKALNDRLQNFLPHNKKVLQYSPLATAFDNSFKEFTTEEQLDAIKENPYQMLMQSLIITERILGPTNPRYAFNIKQLSKKYENINLSVCLNFLICYAEIMQTLDCLSSESLQAFSEILKLNILNGEFYQKKLIHVFKISVDYIEREIIFLKNVKTLSSEEKKIFDNSLFIPLYLIGIITNDLQFFSPNDCNEIKTIIKRLLNLNPKTISNGYTLPQLACISNNSKYGVIFPNKNIITALLLA